MKICTYFVIYESFTAAGSQGTPSIWQLSSDVPAPNPNPENLPPPPIGFTPSVLSDPQIQPQALPLQPAAPGPLQPQTPAVQQTTQRPSWVRAGGNSVPAGAFAGGHDLNDEVLYVGRAEHMNSLTPGKVNLSHETCYIAWGGREHGKSSFEVLVGSAKWIPGTGSVIPHNAIEGKFFIQFY